MFAVGVNLNASAFAQVFQRPQVTPSTRRQAALKLISLLTASPADWASLQHILVGSLGQWIVKPLLGLTTAASVVPLFGLPAAVGNGIVLVRTTCSNMTRIAASAWHSAHASRHSRAVLCFQHLVRMLEQNSEAYGSGTEPQLSRSPEHRGVPSDSRQCGQRVCGELVNAGVLCFRRPAVKLCNFLGASRPSASQHSADSAFDAARSGHHSCPCPFAAWKVSAQKGRKAPPEQQDNRECGGFALTLAARTVRAYGTPHTQ